MTKSWYNMVEKGGNQQDYSLNNEQLQVLLTGTFGDGCITKNKNNNSFFTTSCIHREYIDFKKELLGNVFSSRSEHMNMGYKRNTIYKLRTKSSVEITKLHDLSLEEKLRTLDELGLSLWFYDDGSLHKKNGFFNLNTQCFSEEVHNDLFIPYFKNIGLSPKVFKDRKKDGREFCYLYFGKHFGTYEIMQILKKHPINCYKYKLWSSETILLWSKLKAQLKSENKVISPRKFENIILGRSTL